MTEKYRKKITKEYFIRTTTPSILQKNARSFCPIQALIGSPSKSPDLNPIEMLWHAMKTFIRKRFCKTPDEVVFAILDWIDTVTPIYAKNT